jgi:hypothetical protein
LPDFEADYLELIATLRLLEYQTYDFATVADGHVRKLEAWQPFTAATADDSVNVGLEEVTSLPELPCDVLCFSDGWRFKYLSGGACQEVRIWLKRGGNRQKREERQHALPVVHSAGLARTREFTARSL